VSASEDPLPDDAAVVVLAVKTPQMQSSTST
jgi:hypothetical protein